MSINFNEQVSLETVARLKEAFGPPVAADGKTFLYDDLAQVERSTMAEIARQEGQPVDVELHEAGDIKVMSDGTRYQVTKSGWRKL